MFLFMIAAQTSARTKLLDAALQQVRTSGYEAATVDGLCRVAGVTKGAFFHHFKSKEELGVEATRYWTQVTGAMFAAAHYHDFEDPLDQLIAYIDFRRQLLEHRSIPEATCLLGTMVQETYSSNPALREACRIGIETHAGTIAEIVAAAKARHAPMASWSAEGLALHTQAVIQGAFILAKARADLSIAADSILHLRRYIELLFHYGKED
jgi:TetR/AcrR family transcriptional regulator, transcriptional repressor for nem operon